MSSWYYARQGKQSGPVPQSELERLAEAGEFDPQTDLVWRDGMTDWLPAAQVPQLSFSRPRTAPEPLPVPAIPDASDPYSVGSATFAAPAPVSLDEREEIQPGSQPISIGDCISRSFELTKRHFPMIIAVGAIYLGITFAISMIQQLIISGLEIATGSTEQENSPVVIAAAILLNVVSHVISVFLGLGVTRIGLNIVDGKPFDIAMIFGEGSKLLRTIGAGILYGLAVFVGLLLLIVPGIYIALRFGQFQNAIVDRDMGVSDAFAYSSSITENNRLNLFGLGVVCFLIIVAGLLALFVGLIFAYPIAWLAGLVAYRWMQYGPDVTRDAV